MIVSIHTYLRTKVSWDSLFPGRQRESEVPDWAAARGGAVPPTCLHAREPNKGAHGVFKSSVNTTIVSNMHRTHRVWVTLRIDLGRTL